MVRDMVRDMGRDMVRDMVRVDEQRLAQRAQRGGRLLRRLRLG